MKYTLEERLDIGRRIYEGEITRFQAARSMTSTIIQLATI